MSKPNKHFKDYIPTAEDIEYYNTFEKKARELFKTFRDLESKSQFTHDELLDFGTECLMKGRQDAIKEMIEDFFRLKISELE